MHGEVSIIFDCKPRCFEIKASCFAAERAPTKGQDNTESRFVTLI